MWYLESFGIIIAIITNYCKHEWVGGVTQNMDTELGTH